MPATAIYHHRVEWGETDAAGIVYYPNYFRWFDRATHEFFRAIGFPISDLLDRGYSLPIIDCAATFTRPLFYDDLIEITSRIAELRSRAVRIAHDITRAGEPVAAGHEVRIWVRLSSHQRQSITPEPISPDIRAALLNPSSHS